MEGAVCTARLLKEINPNIITAEIDIILRKFHNYVKEKLINSVTSQGNKPITILDTSVGRGGDISKFLISTPISSFVSLNAVSKMFLSFFS